MGESGITGCGTLLLTCTEAKDINTKPKLSKEKSEAVSMILLFCQTFHDEARLF